MNDITLENATLIAITIICVLVFAITSAIALRDLAGIKKIQDEQRRQFLFGFLIVEITTACVLLFASFLKTIISTERAEYPIYVHGNVLSEEAIGKCSITKSISSQYTIKWSSSSDICETVYEGIVEISKGYKTAKVMWDNLTINRNAEDEASYKNAMSIILARGTTSYNAILMDKSIVSNQFLKHAIPANKVNSWKPAYETPITINRDTEHLTIIVYFEDNLYNADIQWEVEGLRIVLD